MNTLTLSNGRDKKEQMIPAIADAKTRVSRASVVPLSSLSCSLISSYDVNIPKFMAIALATVGALPLHRVSNPSSRTIISEFGKII